MNKSICSKDHFDSEVINVFFEGLDFTPICKICAASFLKNNISCKRYAKTKYTIQCSEAAIYFLATKKGYYLPCCEQCVDDDDTAVTHVLMTHKYGRVNICNQFLKYIYSLNCSELNHMGLIDTYPIETIFIERHENPEYEHYYMDYEHYHMVSIYSDDDDADDSSDCSDDDD